MRPCNRTLADRATQRLSSAHPRPARSRWREPSQSRFYNKHAHQPVDTLVSCANPQPRFDAVKWVGFITISSSVVRKHRRESPQGRSPLLSYNAPTSHPPCFCHPIRRSSAGHIAPYAAKASHVHRTARTHSLLAESSAVNEAVSGPWDLPWNPELQNRGATSGECPEERQSADGIMDLALAPLCSPTKFITRTVLLYYACTVLYARIRIPRTMSACLLLRHFYPCR